MPVLPPPLSTLPRSTPGSLRPTRASRRIAALVAVFTLIVLTLSLLLWWNPLDLVILRRAGYWAPPFAVVGTPLMGIVVAWLTLRDKRAAIVVTVLASVAALALSCVAGALWFLSDAPPTDHRIAEQAGLELVITAGPDGWGERQELVVRRPAGLLTRESRYPLLCARSEFNDPPPRQYESARFASANTVEVVLTDGQRFTVPFDRSTLRPEYTLNVWCPADEFDHPRDLGRP
ncbi:hypothetical protein Val02_64120 [Virgisporangium aliadipatigenens]|uniref:Uncharacterized protein n=1 Tax=Virgisporangium aliadipatigenens TaxID=741659 RepID=A0A8J4DTP8_9ACTN|nr:hypothetical protein [Virgisporangium aliadipatigenens]GIJ49526.1 hypothetical protein Val02_64120 [Virgisporangium aliadipatigenens]